MVHSSLYEIRNKLKLSEYLQIGNGLHVLWFRNTTENYLVSKNGAEKFINKKRCSYSDQQRIYTFLFFAEKRENKTLKNIPQKLTSIHWRH